MVEPIRDLESVLRDLEDGFLNITLDGKSLTINSRTPEGDTPLHLAAHRSDAQAIAVLAAAGADLNARGDMSSTPLHYAVASRCVPAADTLLKLGASPSIRNEFGKSPADDARASGMSELVAVF